MNAALRPETESTRQKVVGDILAGISVALVVIPQGLAYAELAGLPAYHGLYASALAPVLAALFASSPYLQTGPTAMTSLLVFGALSTLAAPFTGNYALFAAMLAILVGSVRVVLGILRAGSLAYFLSTPVLKGFTVAAALLIFSSQVPNALGMAKVEGGVLMSAATALISPGEWNWESIALTAVTLAFVLGGRKLHALFPGVLIAAIAGLVYSMTSGYSGETIGQVPEGFLQFSLALPWADTGSLLLPAAIIAIVGFAEPTAIARNYAAIDRTRWSPNKELISQGAANLASGVVGGLPVGGSFSRSALNRVAGAKTRMAGAVTGIVVIIFLPFAGILAPMPRAVLAAIVIAAVISLFRHVKPLFAFWTQSIPQAGIAWATFVLSLALAPHVEYAILTGIGLSVVVHSWREMRLHVDWVFADGVLTLQPRGVLWFASAQNLEEDLLAALAAYPNAYRLKLDLSGLGRIDYTGALALLSAMETAREGGLKPCLVNVPPQSERIIGKVCPDYVSRASHDG